MDNLPSAFSYLLGDFPDIALWIIGFPVLALLLIFGRLALRSLVNRRVKATSTSSMGFGDLDEMRRTGLISDEEYKTMRSSIAHRAVDKHEAKDDGMGTEQMLAAIQADPSVAKAMITPGSQRARGPAAGAGREAGEAPPVSPELPASVPAGARQAQPADSEDRIKESGILNSGDPRELDDLLAKELISQEEYDRLASLMDQARQDKQT